jgi:hypothetical protein
VSRPHLPPAAAGPDPAIAARWAAELAWWRGRCEIREPLDVDELRRYRALHDDAPAGDAVDAIHACAFAVAPVQASVSAAAYAHARRLRGPAEVRPLRA